MSTPGYLVWRLSTKWRVAVDRALAPIGLTHAQYLAALVQLHEAMRGRADGGDAEIAAELERLGLTTISI